MKPRASGRLGSGKGACAIALAYFRLVFWVQIPPGPLRRRAREPGYVCAPLFAQVPVWRSGRSGSSEGIASRRLGARRVILSALEMPTLAHIVGLANPAAKLVVEFLDARNAELVHKQPFRIRIGSPDPWIDYSALEVEVSIK